MLSIDKKLASTYEHQRELRPGTFVINERKGACLIVACRAAFFPSGWSHLYITMVGSEGLFMVNLEANTALFEYRVIGKPL